MQSTCRAQDAHANALESVVAAGDTARWTNLRFGAVARRVEHWINAIEMDQAIAEALLAERFGARVTRPGPDGPILVGAVALDAPRCLLRLRDRIGTPLAAA